MKNIKSILYFLICMGILQQTYAENITTNVSADQNEQLYEWNIFIYVEASDRMHKESIKNILDCALSGVPNNVHVGILWHADGPNAWLMSVKNNNLVIEKYFPLSASPVSNIAYGVTYNFSQYPAKQYGMIFWDHGFGILEPNYDSTTDEWIIAPDGDEQNVCSIGTIDLSEYTTSKKNHSQKRSMLVDNYNKTCLNNNQMVEICKIISEEILDRKKISFLAMDLCLGAMLEIGYQIRNHVDYIAGTQDCELADGMDYYALMQHLQDNPTMSAQELVTHLVHDYYAYYTPIAPYGRFTQSAINLEYMEPIKNNLDAIVANLLLINTYNQNAFKTMVLNVREQLLSFCIASYYKDLYQIYKILGKELLMLALPSELHECKKDLQKLLSIGQELVSKAVVAHMTGPVTAESHGISIYWPKHHLDSSYPKTMFAQKSKWLEFLEKFLF